MVQDHSPIAAGPHSLPEPDLAVVRGEITLDRHPGPEDLALVVEISVSSQLADRAKAAVYARAGIAEYWNLDVPARTLTVYREPRPEHGEYAVRVVFREGETVPAGRASLHIVNLLP